MITQIGIIAGEVWHYLEKEQQVATLDQMVQHIDKKRDAVLMSIGWLAREGHIILEGDGPDYSISLRK